MFLIVFVFTCTSQNILLHYFISFYLFYVLYICCTVGGACDLRFSLPYLQCSYCANDNKALKLETLLNKRLNKHKHPCWHKRISLASWSPVQGFISPVFAFRVRVCSSSRFDTPPCRSGAQRGQPNKSTPNNEEYLAIFCCQSLSQEGCTETLSVS